MKKIFTVLLAVLPSMMYAQLQPERIVMVVSSYGKDNGKTRPGFEMDEFSQAYLIFKANGLVIDVASPKGGKVETGPFNREKPYNKIVSQDSVAMKLLLETRPTATLHAKDYAALYVVGGKGPMFDLVVDPSLQDFIAEMASNKAIVSAVCHGTIAFANIKKGDQYLIENKLLTGLSNEEERMFGKGVSEFPFLLEDRLLLRGAKYKYAEAMLPHMVRDSNYITGQNPYSTNLVAEEIVRALGRTPVYREKFKDERSMELIRRAILGDRQWAEAVLKKNAADFDLELIAVYGYYQGKNARDDKGKIRGAVDIIELARPYYFNETLYFSLAEYYVKLGEPSKATDILTIVLNKNPGAQKAADLLRALK